MKLNWVTLDPHPQGKASWPDEGRLCIVKRDGAPFLAIANRGILPNSYSLEERKKGLRSVWWNVTDLSPVFMSTSLPGQAQEMWAYLDAEEK